PSSIEIPARPGPLETNERAGHRTASRGRRATGTRRSPSPRSAASDHSIHQDWFRAISHLRLSASVVSPCEAPRMKWPVFATLAQSLLPEQVDYRGDCRLAWAFGVVLGGVGPWLSDVFLVIVNRD